MPGGDHTGPIGLGSRTGRGMGYCAGYGAPGFTTRRFWRRSTAQTPFWRCGRGGGFGWRNMFYATGLPGWLRFGKFFEQEGSPGGADVESPRETELHVLKTQAAFLKSSLENVQKRLAELESQPSEG